MKTKITSTKLIFIGHCVLTIPVILIFSTFWYLISTAIITPIKEIGIIGLAISWLYWLIAAESYILWNLKRTNAETLISAARLGLLPISKNMIAKVAEHE